MSRGEKHLERNSKSTLCAEQESNLTIKEGHGKGLTDKLKRESAWNENQTSQKNVGEQMIF